MAGRRVFSANTVYWLIAVSVLSFAGAAYFMIYGKQGDEGAAGANAFSYSAIGHHGFVELLRRMDIPVLVSRDGSAAKAGSTSLLVVAEPRRTTWIEDTVETLLPAENMLVVLPKWEGRARRDKVYWLERAGLMPQSTVESTLRQLVAGASLRRYAEPVEWDANRFAISPDIANPQLIQSARLKPVIASPQGILVGQMFRGSQRIWVISDPDILSNHGLGRGDNAVLSLRLVEAMRPAGGAVIVDETIHGYWQPQSLWRSLFELPLAIPTILALATILVLAWCASGRFGAPLPARPALKPGKTALIDNTASLLRFGGYGSEILRRYARVTLREVATRLNAPRKLDEDGLIDWVDRVGKARGVGARFRTLHERAARLAGDKRTDALHLAGTARRLYRWKQEMTNGS